MKKYLYTLILLFISFFINSESIFAASINDYRVGKFIYYDPVNGNYCSSDNFWTKYNQNTTCYRWAIIDKYENLGVIRIMIDHNIAVSDFAGRGSAINSAIKDWKIPALTDAQKEALNLSSSNGLGNLGTNMVLKLYNGNVDRKNGNGNLINLYEFNKECINLETPCYKEKDINRIRFIASNMTSAGYWLSDSINNEEHKQITTNDAYEFYMDKNGQILLADKTLTKGVRLTLYIDVSILSGRTFLESEISLKNNNVSINNNYFNLIGDSNNLNFYAQGFTTIGENKHLFYLQNLSNKKTEKSDGILLYINGSTMKFVEGGNDQNHFPFAHGNGLSYDKKNEKLYVTAKEWSNNVLSRFSLSINNLKTNYVLGNDYVQYRNKVEGDKDKNINFDLATVAIDDTGNRLFSISGNQKLILWYIKKKEDNTITWDIENSFDIPEYHGTLQNLTYMNGYLYVAVYESCIKDYQIFCYGNKHAANIYVYNAKFNPDGTPNRWFGQLVNSYYSYDFNNNNTIHEIEGIGSWEDTIYVGFAKKNLGEEDENLDGEKDASSYEPAVYKFEQTFYNLTYRLGNSEYTDKIIPNKFADMGLYLKGNDGVLKTHTNGFIGWKAPNGTVYTNPDKTSLRITENTALNGVYIELISGYSFDSNNIKISKRVTIEDLLKEVKVYNAEIKVKRNNEVVNNLSDYVQHNDTLVIGIGTTDLKTYNLIPTKYQVKYLDGTSTYENEYNDNTEISLKSNLSKPGYTFIGWKDLSDNRLYSLNEKYTIKKADVVFEAVWEAINYNVSYNANGGTGTMNNSSHTYDASKALNKNTFTKVGYTFKGWSKEQNGEVIYQDEQVVKNLTDIYEDLITLYAVWEANKYTIVYNANSGTGTMENSTFTYDVQGKLSKNTFTKNGYKFKGWSTSSSGVTVFQDEQSIKNLTTQGIITLYASWEAVNEVNIDEVISNKYLIKDKKVYNIPKKTGVNNLILGLNNNYSYKIYDEINTNILTEGYIGTGNLLKVYMNGTLKKEYRVIIKGDITGEGEIEVNDVAKLYQHIKGKNTMADYYKEAANVEETNSDLAVSDVAKLYQYIKGKITSLED